MVPFFASEIKEKSFVLRRSMRQRGLKIFFFSQNPNASKFLLYFFASEMLEKKLCSPNINASARAENLFSQNSSASKALLVFFFLVRCRKKSFVLQRYMSAKAKSKRKQSASVFFASEM